MSDNVDSSRRAVHFRPSMSPPVHGGVDFVCANVALDVPLLAVVVWPDERRCRTMSTRRGARYSVDHRPRCLCTVAPPSCAPRLPMMYQYSLWWNGGPHADFGQCRLIEARCAVSTVDLAACARWHRRRVRQRCLRCTSTRGCCLVGRAQMSHNVDPSRRATQCRPAISPPVRAGTVERLKCMITHMDALIRMIYSLPRGRFPSDADSPDRRAERATDAAGACAQTKRTSHFQASIGVHWHVRLDTNVTIKH
jgi:hypothetical protein